MSAPRVHWRLLRAHRVTCRRSGAAQCTTRPAGRATHGTPGARGTPSTRSSPGEGSLIGMGAATPTRQTPQKRGSSVTTAGALVTTASDDHGGHTSSAVAQCLQAITTKTLCGRAALPQPGPAAPSWATYPRVVASPRPASSTPGSLASGYLHSEPCAGASCKTAVTSEAPMGERTSAAEPDATSRRGRRRAHRRVRWVRPSAAQAARRAAPSGKSADGHRSPPHPRATPEGPAAAGTARVQRRRSRARRSTEGHPVTHTSIIHASGAREPRCVDEELASKRPADAELAGGELAGA